MHRPESVRTRVGGRRHNAPSPLRTLSGGPLSLSLQVRKLQRHVGRLARRTSVNRHVLSLSAILHTLRLPPSPRPPGHGILAQGWRIAKYRPPDKYAGRSPLSSMPQPRSFHMPRNACMTSPNAHRKTNERKHPCRRSTVGRPSLYAKSVFCCDVHISRLLLCCSSSCAIAPPPSRADRQALRKDVIMPLLGINGVPGICQPSCACGTYFKFWGSPSMNMLEAPEDGHRIRDDPVCPPLVAPSMCFHPTRLRERMLRCTRLRGLPKQWFHLGNAARRRLLSNSS